MAKKLTSKEIEARWQAAFKAGTMGDMFDWSLPAITLDGCMEVIQELANTGDKSNNMKLACWAGVTSINTKLVYNGNATRLLSRFVDSALPGYDELKALFKSEGTKFGCMPSVYESMKEIETRYADKTLPEMPQATWTFAQWDTWRDEMVKLPGISYKVASFIGLLLHPLTCPLVPVDRWVMRRLNKSHGSVPQGKLAYTKVEDIVRDERDKAGHDNLPLGAWHWYKWSQARQAAGPNIEVASVKPESHSNLSPRWY